MIKPIYINKSQNRRDFDCGEDELNDEDLEKAYNVIVEMNKMYFSGFRNNALINITASEGFSTLKNISSCFAQEYVLSMLNDEFENNNTLFIPFSN